MTSPPILPEPLERRDGQTDYAGTPFGTSALAYRDSGWTGVLPLPPGKKNPPPKGRTGAGGVNAPAEQLAVEVQESPNANIGLRLGEVDREFWPGYLPVHYNGQVVDGWELIGIDIDTYKAKHGDEQFAAWLAEHGELPATLLSGARLHEDRVSYIALFWVPKGYRFVGKIAEAIEVVQKRHRYMLVWPSMNPDAPDPLDPSKRLPYMWATGVPGEPGSAAVRIDGVPELGRVAVLPEAHFFALTNGRVDEGAEALSDLSDLSDDELVSWAEGNLNDFHGEPCARMTELLERHKTALTELGGSDSHGPLTSVVWNLTCEAVEGHAGGYTALMGYLAHWVEVTGEKRDLATMRAEIGRSFGGALRKKHPEWEASGNYVPDDLCDDRGYDADRWAERFAAKGSGDEEFWAARLELTKCLQFARSRRVGPWAMFGHALVLCMSIVPPNVVLPPIVATHAGLNLFIALTGPSGAIKSGAMGAAADWLQVEPTPKLVKPGSGEGLAKCYAYIHKPKNQPAEQIGKEWSLVAHIPEVDTLNATGSRGGSTLMSELRYAWSGERLGHDYAGEDKAITLAANRYRLGMTVGVQPERARALFDDKTGGTPQRFIWMPTDDPEAPDERPEEPLSWLLQRWPEPETENSLFDLDLNRKMSLGMPADKSEFAVLAVPQQAWDQQDSHTLAKLRNPASVDPLNGHKLLARLKVAAALMVLNGRYDKVSDEDWELAGKVMAVSDRTREHVQERLAAETLERNKSAGRAAAYREQAAEETKAGLYDENVKRVAGNILKVVARMDGKAARRKVLNKIAQRDRAKYFDDAEEWLLSRGRISKTAIVVNGTEGYELELVSGGPKC